MAAVNSTFVEKQSFNQWWLWTILGLIYLSPFLVNLTHIIEFGFWETFSKGIYGHIITLGLVLLLFLSMKLTTVVDQSGIKIRYFPFLTKKFAWEAIAKTEMINYSRWQTRGSGIRFWTTYGVVYSVKGRNGLSLKLKNGKKYMIGTQKPKAMLEVLKDYI